MTKGVSIQSSLVRVVLLLVFLSITMPSGSVYGFNFKIAISVLILFLLTLDVFRTCLLPRSFLAIASSFFLFFLLTISVALSNSVAIESVISQSLAFASVLMIVLTVIYILEKQYIKSIEFIKFVCIVAVLHCVIKLIVESLLISGVITDSFLRAWLPSVFGANILLLDYGFFYRLNMASDFILPFSVFCFLAFPEITRNRMYRNISILIITFSLFITYSRYLWLYGVFAIALGYLISTRITKGRITFGAIVAKKLPVLFGMFFIVLGVLVATGVSNEITSRFVGSNAASSDAQRDEMYSPLIEKYAQYPILGVGMGGYTEKLIRVERLPWNYELQWIAFAMQFGVFGVFFLALIAMLPMVVYFNSNFTYGAVLMMYVFWVGVGFFNSFLITSASGVVYSAYVVLGRYINNR